MKRFTAVAGTVLSGLLILWSALPLPVPAQQETIKIGVIYGLGGASAPYTKPAITGHEIAVDEINAKGGLLGRKLQLVIRDDQSKPDVGVREARELIVKEKVDFLMGVIHSGVALGISEVAKEYKKIYLNTIAKTAALTEEKGHRYVFRSASNTVIEGRAAAILMAYRLVYYVIPWAVASLLLLSWVTRRAPRRLEVARRVVATLGDGDGRG